MAVSVGRERSGGDPLDDGLLPEQLVQVLTELTPAREENQHQQGSHSCDGIPAHSSDGIPAVARSNSGIPAAVAIAARR